MTIEVPLSAEVEIMRQKCRDDTATPEELRELLAKLRAGRISAASAPVRSRVKAVAVNTQTLLDDL